MNNKQNKQFNYQPIYLYPIAAMLNLTDNCNLACKYCFVEQHPHNMTLEIAKQAVQYIYNNIQKRKELKYEKILKPDFKSAINFFGGEPMLRYNEVIKPLVLWVEKTYPDLFSFGITSNVTLLTKEPVDFFKEHGIGILTSIDGAEYTQCYNRPCRNGDNSFKLVEQNISYILEQFPMTTFRSTIYAPTVDHFYENYLYVEHSDFKNYAPVLDERTEWTPEQLKTLEEQLIKIQYHRLQARSLRSNPVFCHSFNLTSINFADIDCQTHCFNNKDDCLVRCGLGTTGCAIGWDGKIYGCQQDVSLDDKNLFYIGDIYNGIDIERHSKLLKKYYNEIIRDDTDLPEKCQDCYLKDTCYGINAICPSTNMAVFGHTHRISEAKCVWMKTIFKTSLLENDILSRLQTNFYDRYMPTEDTLLNNVESLYTNNWEEN